jgi:hypothetical protein
MRSLLVALSSYAAGRAAALGVGEPTLPDVRSSWALNSARRASAADECTVDWLGSDDETTFEASLALLTVFPNEHDTLAGADIVMFTFCARPLSYVCALVCLLCSCAWQ